MNNRIYILGTVHEDTENYTSTDLYNKLCEIKPDVILIEQQIDLVHHVDNIIARSPGMEASAIREYLKIQHVDIKPYDIAHRNESLQMFFPKEEAYRKAYRDYFAGENPNPITVLKRQAIIDLNKEQDKWDEASMEEINSDACDDVTLNYVRTIGSLNEDIYNLVPEIAPFKTDYLAFQAFHKQRELAMAENILQYNQEYENKIIVVMCGYYHRFHIRQSLKK